MSQKSNKIFIKFIFHTRVQTSADTFDSFVTDLKLLFQECGYADLNLMARDQIVLSVSLPTIQEKQLFSVGSDLIVRNANSYGSRTQDSIFCEFHQDRPEKTTKALPLWTCPAFATI